MCVCVCHRRKKDGNVFLVAFYECDEEYELDSPDTDRLYCSKETWIGNRPNCISITNDDNDENEEYDEDEENNEQDGEEEEEEEDGKDGEEGKISYVV